MYITTCQLHGIHVTIAIFWREDIYSGMGLGSRSSPIRLPVATCTSKEIVQAEKDNKQIAI